MSAEPTHDTSTLSGDTEEHVADARDRARQVLSGEAHLGAVDDWRRVLVGARDALILIWLIWVALEGFGRPPFTGFMLVAMAIALAVLVGISTGRATHTQIEYFSQELERERCEIRTNLEHEKEEVRVLYAAKGFQEPLLGQIVETLSADDDRLLKVMMEEELGLSMHHVQHPLIVGLWNFAGTLVAGLALTVPALWLSPAVARVWIPVGGAASLALISLLASRATGRSALEWFTVGLVMAAVTGGIVYFLSQSFAGLMPGPLTV